MALGKISLYLEALQSAQVTDRSGQAARIYESTNGVLISDVGQISTVAAAATIVIYVEDSRSYVVRFFNTAGQLQRTIQGVDPVTDYETSLPSTGSNSAFTFVSRSLTDTDNSATLVCQTAQSAQVNRGLASGFGCAFKGTVSFTGSATVNDVRLTGATDPWCALVQTGKDVYDVVGGKT